LVNGTDLNAWKKAVQKNTKAFFLESPTNPTLEVINIAAVAEIAHNAGARLVVDNVFATPLYQRPLTLGADCVVYSATKHIDGQGRVLGGIILGSEKLILDHYHQILRQTGPSLSPLIVGPTQGPETLPVQCSGRPKMRSGRQCASGQEDHAIDLPRSVDHPQAELIKQMLAGSTLCSFGSGRQGRCLPISQ
jgi:O-succinylhomoserine sulfhydrylase